MDILEDVSGAYSIHQVSSLPLSGQFIPNDKSGLGLGFTESAWWVRFRTNSLVHGRLLELAKANLDQVDVYFPTPEGYVSYLTGDDRPAENRDLRSRTFGFRIPETYWANQYIYLRLQSHTSLNLKVRLWSVPAWEDYTAPELVIFGLLLGGILVLAVYNLFIYLTLKDNTYLYYVIYMSAITLFQFRLYGISYVLLDLPPGMGPPLTWLLLATSQMGAVMFTRSFLDTRMTAVLMDRLLMGFGVLALLVGVFGVTGQYRAANFISHLFGGLSPLVCLFAGFLAFRKGFIAARYFLLGWSVLALCTFIFSMGGVLFPSTYFTFHVFLPGTVLEAIFLSFALAERIRSLKNEQTKLRRQKEYLAELSIRDDLTGLYNKRWFSSTLASEMANAGHLDLPLALLMLDVDHFKNFNDSYGHAKGDKVLAKLGAVISNSVRETDIPCRYGGEEFSVILTGIGQDEALGTAERLRSNFEKEQFKVSENETARVTISIGVSVITKGDDEAELFRRADKALYLAKSQGRNCVVAL